MAISDLKGNMTSLAKSITGNIEKATIILGGFSQASEFSLRPDAEKAIQFELPFNPSSIRLEAVAGGGHKKVTTTGGVNYGTVDPRVQVSFTVYVDEVNNYDAFLYERVDKSGAVGLARTAYHAVSGQEYSVAVYAEGLLASLRSAENSHIIFSWGKMTYEGTLNSVEAKYTMFNPDGNPIKAEIHIRILCVSGEKKTVREEWRIKYEDALKVLSGADDMSEDVMADMSKASAVSRYISL